MYGVHSFVGTECTSNTFKIDWMCNSFFLPLTTCRLVLHPGEKTPRNTTTRKVKVLFPQATHRNRRKHSGVYLPKTAFPPVLETNCSRCALSCCCCAEFGLVGTATFQGWQQEIMKPFDVEMIPKSKDVSMYGFITRYRKDVKMFSVLVILNHLFIAISLTCPLKTLCNLRIC